jgi:hypothetical protein
VACIGNTAVSRLTLPVSRLTLGGVGYGNAGEDFAGLLHSPGVLRPGPIKLVPTEQTVVLFDLSRSG